MSQRPCHARASQRSGYLGKRGQKSSRYPTARPQRPRPRTNPQMGRSTERAIGPNRLPSSSHPRSTLYGTFTGTVIGPSASQPVAKPRSGAPPGRSPNPCNLRRGRHGHVGTPRCPGLLRGRLLPGSRNSGEPSVAFHGKPQGEHPCGTSGTPKRSPHSRRPGIQRLRRPHRIVAAQLGRRKITERSPFRLGSSAFSAIPG
jgi:hypothetical protein